jgi:hypothetical protein
MEIIYSSGEHIIPLHKSYHITNSNNDDIGTVEGSGNIYGEFISVVKIYHPDFKNKGLGFDAFKKVFDEINSQCPISVIKGSWHKGGEFKDFENGMSTNLKVFLECLKTQSPNESAFKTPTGKWVRQLGFSQCTIVSHTDDNVLVNFYNKLAP